MRCKWTIEQQETLRVLWNVKQLPAKEIAEKMGLTRNSVIGKANRMKLARRVAADWREDKPPLEKVEKYKPPLEKPKEGGNPVILAEIKNNQCRWPVGGGRGGNLLCCGVETKETYCPDHKAKSLQKTKAHGDGAKTRRTRKTIRSLGYEDPNEL